jgi:hypothetical protein
VAVLDENNRVVRSEVLNVGSLAESIVDRGRIVRMIKQAQKQYGGNLGLMAAHNHPSGDPTPSGADHRITNVMRELVEVTGARFVDHVVTNGRKFFSFEDNAFHDIENPVDAPWEAVTSGTTAFLNQPDAMLEMLGALRKGDPDAGYLVALTTQLRVAAVVQVPNMQMLSRNELSNKAYELAAGVGARSMVIGTPESMGWSDGSVRLIQQMKHDLELMDVNVPDASVMAHGGQYVSLQTAGILESPQWVQERSTWALAEDPNKYNPVGTVLKGKWIPREMAHMDRLNPAKMPELRLTRSVTLVTDFTVA